MKPFLGLWKEPGLGSRRGRSWLPHFPAMCLQRAEPLLGLAEQRPHLWGIRGASWHDRSHLWASSWQEDGIDGRNPPRTRTQHAAAFVKYGGPLGSASCLGGAPHRTVSATPRSTSQTHTWGPCAGQCVSVREPPHPLFEEWIFRKTF